MKQIPLTYFRTYTYQQPLTSSPIQLPLLSSTDYVTNYNALNNARYFNPLMPVVPMSLSTSNEIPLDTRPSKRFGNNFNMVRSLGPLPVETTTTTTEPTTTRTTTTTTTTTTTPPPTTTTTTTTEPTTPSMPSQVSDTNDFNLHSPFPTFNRKAFTNHFNINYNRPVYPYPEYSLNEKAQASSNIEFVPCMCPVSIPNTGFPSGFQTGLPAIRNPSNSLFVAQSRTNVDADVALDAPLANGALDTDAKAAEEDTNSRNDLVEVLKLNEDEEAATSSQIL